MGVLIELGEEGVNWHLFINEQFNLPLGANPKKVMDFLMNNGIIFGVTYSDYGLHILLQNVEYVDDNYDNFLKVATNILMFKKEFNKVVEPLQTDEEKIQQVFSQPVEETEPVVPKTVVEPDPSLHEYRSSQPVDNTNLKQPPKQ